jgi:rare lipoprotein A
MRQIFEHLPRFLLLAVFGLALSACSSLQFMAAGYKQYQGPPAQGNFKVGKPYNIAGRTYYPEESYNLDETGIASWYGPGFHGGRTANGETFDKYELTAAHRTLQLPALVRVTNLENGKSVVVRVNDRGPFARGRVIDVSRRAAELLGFIGNGTAKVRVQVLPDESRQVKEMARRGESTRGVELALNNLSGGPTLAPLPRGDLARDPVKNNSILPVKYTPPAPPIGRSVPIMDMPTSETAAEVPVHAGPEGVFYPDPVVTRYPVMPTQIFVQAGTFADHGNAIKASQQLSALGPVRIKPVTSGSRELYRVQVGPVRDVRAADGLLSRVINAGHTDAVILVDNSS